jgi:hypothetical protein
LAELLDLHRKQVRKENKVQQSRKPVEGRQVWRTVSDSAPLLWRARFDNAIRSARLARYEQQEISRMVFRDGSTDKTPSNFCNTQLD